MGLDTTHDAWHGGYGRFNFWRIKVAKAVGIPLELMEGFYADDYRHPLSMVKDAVERVADPSAKEQLARHLESFPLSWDAFTPSALHELLYHSDCDGEIDWQNCLAIAIELERTFPNLDDDTKALAERFAKGLRLANEKQENLEFH